MTRAYLYNAEKDWERFWTTYEALESDPLYAVQTDSDSRYEMDVAWLRSKGFFEQALSRRIRSEPPATGTPSSTASMPNSAISTTPTANFLR